MKQYDEIKRKLLKGWNTWNTRSVLSHVLLPEGFALNLGLKEYKGGQYLKEALIGRQDQPSLRPDNDRRTEKIRPEERSYDGTFSRLIISWQGIELVIQSAAVDEDIVILVTPVKNQKKPSVLIVESGFLWNKPGYVLRENNTVYGICGKKRIGVFSTEPETSEPYICAQTPYLALLLDKELGISTGRQRTLEEIRRIVRKAASENARKRKQYGALAEVYDALQSSLAWDTIYEPLKDRIITTVSRVWNNDFWGGYSLYCWDTYFAAFMFSLDCKDRAYANIIEITREKTEEGFVPNCSAAIGFKTRDRSQPPVGSLMLKMLFDKFGDTWILEELFDDLYSWNTWFFENRMIKEGLLSWGTSPYQPVLDNYWETAGVGDFYGAGMESGMDNSPMYTDVPLNRESHTMVLADVGLTSLYTADCSSLAEIAGILGRDEESILRRRADVCGRGLQNLWNEKAGIFMNKRIDTGSFSSRLSPTCFYPLLTDYVSSDQAQRIIDEHFYNPDEFWGEWIMPSIARNDPAYPDQEYWRGRIWAPLNFLVYLGLRKHHCTRACRDMAEKSKGLLLKEWLERGHVHENYNAETGEGCDKSNKESGISGSDPFYHWGALLGVIALMEDGFM